MQELSGSAPSLSETSTEYVTINFWVASVVCLLRLGAHTHPSIQHACMHSRVCMYRRGRDGRNQLLPRSRL